MKASDRLKRLYNYLKANHAAELRLGIQSIHVMAKGKIIARIHHSGDKFVSDKIDLYSNSNDVILEKVRNFYYQTLSVWQMGESK